MSKTRRFRHFLRFQRALGQFLALALGLFLGLIVLPFILAGEIYDYQDSVDGVRLPDADAIVCLAGGRGRISAAGDLWYRYMETAQAPRVVRASSISQPQLPETRVPALYISGAGPQANLASLGRQL